MKLSSILPIVLVVLLLSCNQSQKTTRERPDDSPLKVSEEKNRNETDTLVNGSLEKSFTSQKFGFKIAYPNQWTVADTGDAYPVVHVFNPDQVDEGEMAVRSEGENSFISIFPRGFGVELPFGQQTTVSKTDKDVPVNFEVDQDESIVFMLENGEVWGYLIKPENPPQGWTEDGFIFAQAVIKNFQIKCLDEKTKAELSRRVCDPLMGDNVQRLGDVSEVEKRKVDQILESLTFIDKNDTQAIESLKVEYPKSGQIISSPLEVEGEARGTWYFEADFPIRLEDKEGNVLARHPAKAQGKWMTEDFVPFTSTLTFKNSPKGEKGYLVFEKANPSGLPENAEEVRVPVRFED